MMTLLPITHFHLADLKMELLWERKKWMITLPASGVIIIGGLFLAFATHQILPNGVNVISQLGYVAVSTYTLCLATGVIIILIALVKLNQLKKAKCTEDYLLLAQQTSDQEKAISYYYKAAIVAHQNQTNLLDLGKSFTAYLDTLPECSQHHQRMVSHFYLILGETAFNKNSFALAATCFMRSTHLLDELHHLMLIASLIKIKNMQDAEVQCLQINEKFPAFEEQLLYFDREVQAAIFCMLGKHFFMQNAFSKAQIYFNKSHAQEPVSLKVLSQWIFTLIREQKFAQIVHLLHPIPSEDCRSLINDFMELSERLSEETKGKFLALLGKTAWAHGEDPRKYFKDVSWNKIQEEYFIPDFLIYVYLTAKDNLSTEALLQNTSPQQVKQWIASLKSLEIPKDQKSVIFSQLGISECHQRHYETAIDCFKQIVHLGSNERVFAAEANLYADNPNYEASESLLEGLVTEDVSKELFPRLASIFLRLGHVHLQKQSRPLFVNFAASFVGWASDSESNQGIYFYQKACPLFPIAAAEQAWPLIISDMQKHDPLKKMFLDTAQQCCKNEEWENSAVWSFLVMHSAQQTQQFFDSPFCQDGMKNFIRAAEQAVKEKHYSVWWLDLIERAIALRGDLTKLVEIRKPSLVKSVIWGGGHYLALIPGAPQVMREDQFLYDMGGRLHALKAQHLEHLSYSKEAILAEYQLAWCLHPQNPFGAGALFLEDSQHSMDDDIDSLILSYKCTQMV